MFLCYVALFTAAILIIGKTPPFKAGYNNKMLQGVIQATWSQQTIAEFLNISDKDNRVYHPKVVENLQKYGRRVVNVRGDGDCFFESVRLQLKNNRYNNEDLRASACKFGFDNAKEIYSDKVVHESFINELTAIRDTKAFNNATFDLIPDMLSRVLGRKIIILNNTDGKTYITPFYEEDVNDDFNDDTVIVVYFANENHYISTELLAGAESLPCECVILYKSILIGTYLNKTGSINMEHKKEDLEKQYVKSVKACK